MNKDDIMVFDIKNENLERALMKALENDFIDNLRDRNEFVQLDSKIRGFLGELLIADILIENNILIISTGASEVDETDIDIFLDNKTHNDLKMEVKTSLIPDRWKNLESVFKLGDIKIIKREKNYKDIKSDFHVQIYFNYLTNERDRLLSNISGKIEDYTINELVDLMELDKLRHAFVAWIDKNTLIQNLNSAIPSKRTWHFSYRDFWACKIYDARKYADFIEGIISYKRDL